MPTLHEFLPLTDGLKVKAAVSDTVYTYSAALNAWEKSGTITGAIASVAPTTFDDATPVILTGSGLTGATAVSLNDQAAAAFVVDSDTQITVTPDVVLADTDTLITVSLADGSIVVAEPLCVHEVSGSDPDVTAAINAIEATGVTLSTAQKDAAEALILDKKTDGRWADTLALYLFLGPTAAAQAINAKTPGTYNIVWNGPAMTHDADGVTGIDDVTSYGDTGISPTDLPQEDVSVTAFIVTQSAAAGSNYVFGCQTGTDNFSLWRNPSSPNEMRAYINDNTRMENASGTPGYVSLIRDDSPGRSLTADGTAVTDTVAATPRPTDNIYLMARNNDGTNDRTSQDTIGCISFYSRALTTAEDTANKAAVEAYNTALGR